MKNKPPLVDFLYLGPPKSASTWLFQILNNQSQVKLPAAKDIYYFDRYYYKGDQWYEDLFDNPSRNHCVGEISHDYIYSKDAAKRIKKYNPNMKFIAILRHPVERAISHYKYSYKVGNVKGSLAESIAANPSIIDCGFLSDSFKHYLNYFDRESFLILDFEEIKKKPELVANKIGIFLNISIKQSDNSNKIVNPANISRSRILTKSLRSLGNLVRRAGFPNIVGYAKSSLLISLLYKKDKRKITKVLDEEKLMLFDVYKDEIKKIKNTFPKELESW